MAILSWIEDVEDEYMGYNLSALRKDEYYVNFSNVSPDYKYVYKQYKECDECPYLLEKSLPAGASEVLKTSSEYPEIFQVSDIFYETALPPEAKVLCIIDESFGEFGIYDIHLNDLDCEVKTVKEPVDIYFPILTVILIFTGLCCLTYLGIYLWNKYLKKKPEVTDLTDINDVKEFIEKPVKERVMSLDTFRGASILLMIFVNYGAGGYSLFDHEVWNGLHLADVIFPCFLWIMGMCIPISVASHLKKGLSKRTGIVKVIKRSAILFSLGLFLGSGEFLKTMRIFGVLQRFGICYLAVAIICFLCYKVDRELQATGKFEKLFEDIIRVKIEWAIMILIFVCHTLIIFWVAEPGCPRGYLGPGGYHKNGSYFNCTGGATGYIDKLILGRHIYQYPTAKKIYNSKAFDPEGILGCLPSIVHTFFGVQAGVTLQTFQNKYDRIVRWLIWAVITGLAGGGLCGFSKNGGVIPINKNLWSISFVLVTSSLSFVLIAACYYIIDVKKWWNGKPLVFAGMNSILMYVGHSLIYSNFPIHWYWSTRTHDANHFWEFLENTWATNIWLAVSYYLFKIKYFFSI